MCKSFELVMYDVIDIYCIQVCIMYMYILMLVSLDEGVDFVFKFVVVCQLVGEDVWVILLYVMENILEYVFSYLFYGY